MRIKPILMNTAMVRAILDGRKTVTRRLPSRRVEREWILFADDRYSILEPGQVSREMMEADKRDFILARSPYQPGDILWVRETWSTTDRCGLFPPWPSTGTHYIYKAELEPGHPYETEARWFPSIHMPRAAARIFLRVTKVWAEQLQDIDDKGAVAEGVDPMDLIPWVAAHTEHPGVDMDALVGREQERELRKLIELHFGKEIWDSNIKPKDLALYGWKANPPVLVNEFERLPGPPEGFFTDADAAQYADKPAPTPAT